jgi:hypothetical protein
MEICPVVWYPKAATARSSLAVAVEVGRLDVRHARPAVEPHGRPELAVGKPAQPDHRALVMVARKELAEIGDEEILQAVAVEVHGRHVIGMREARQDRHSLAVAIDEARSSSPCAIPSPAGRAAPSPSKSTSRTFDTRGRRRDLRHGQLPVDELDRRLCRVGPRLRRRQAIGCVLEVEGEAFSRSSGSGIWRNLLARGPAAPASARG